MSNKITPIITTYEDLLQEKQRLQQKLVLQKADLKHNWSVFTHKLSPIEKVVGVVKNLTTPDTRNPLVNTGLNLGIDLLLRGFYMARIGWLPKIVVPFVLKNLSSNLVNKKGKSIFKSLRSLIGKNGKAKHHHD
ncbi:MAG TPA: hypothetical protein VEB42_14135 [Chitinophagaceae bacterium]|nr:hypothetical protein [Chitinophagaceae bacterium]